jgi:multidrug efflux pump
MSLSSPFIRRPVATTLLTAAVALFGAVAFRLLPVAPLPQVDFPTISVGASLPGASPEIMASSIATPLERQFGRIAAVTEMTSTSTLGQTGITLQFDLNRNIDAAARDVEAAINAARGFLPADLPMNPTYRKINPADAPIMILALTSSKLPPSALYDAGSTVLMQRISQIRGVGQVIVGGSSAPAVRVDVNPTQLNSYGLQLDSVRTAIAAATANIAKGTFSDTKRTWMIEANDQLLKAADYKKVIIAFRNGAPIKLSSIANVTDSVQTLRSLGISNGRRSALIIIFREPGANIIDTVDGIKAAIPQLKASIDPSIELTITLDQTQTIRASVSDIEETLLIAICLVVLVVFVFLRDARSTFIPSVAVPVSLIGTCGAMYLLGYSIDNLSLMALTISTGFVVDDAIVVLENITRYREQGMTAMEAAFKGAAEIGPTVLSISVSLVAVFIPILLMGGIVGRLFREFAVTLSITILISLLISLTTTPMMCSQLLSEVQHHGRFYMAGERVFNSILKGYEHSLRWVLRNSALVLLIAVGTLALNLYLFVIVPKGFFPEEDTGRLNGNFIGDQDISFQGMAQKLIRLAKIVQSDPAVATVQAFSGGGAGTTTNTGRAFIMLKPRNERTATAEQIIARLRPKLAAVPGVTLYLQASQDIRVGGRMSAAEYQYTLQSDNLDLLNRWAPILMNELKKLPELTDVNSDQQNHGLEADVVIDRMTAARMGVTAQTVDQVLYDAFGEREIARTYSSMNQYFVIMEVNPVFWQSPEGLKKIYVTPAVSTPTNTFTAAIPAFGAPASSNSLSSSPPTGLPPAPAAALTSGPSVPGQAVNTATTTGLGSSITATTGTGIIGTSTNTSLTNSASPVLSTISNALAPAANVTPAVGSASPTGLELATTPAPPSKGGLVPLAAFTHFQPSTAALSVNHSGVFPSITLSFNLAPGIALGQAVNAIAAAERRLGMPSTILTSFSGTAQAFQASLANEPFLIATALAAVYIILGILYESYVHPITILSTLPSAGVGALLALMITHTALSVIAIIGLLLLIGIVKKNAIMMIDFALDVERHEGKTPDEAIFQACLLRFRPIMMTTIAAMFGALPLAVGSGMGYELRRPLGITIVGGLIVSQALTLYTTPVIYLYMDRFSLWLHGHKRPHLPESPASPLGSVT